MQHQVWKPVLLAIAALSLTAVMPLTVSAQDHPEDRHEQPPQDHHDDQSAMRRDDHHDADHRDANDHHDYNRPDPAVQYRHDHPNAAARCHDGFFTNTRDRGHACSKHGGIDVWLAI